MAENLQVGMRVAVHFSGRREVGIVTALPQSTDVPASRLKNISAVLDEGPVLDEDLMELTRWMGHYYGCSWGEALAAVSPLPSSVKGVAGRLCALAPQKESAKRSSPASKTSMWASTAFCERS